MTQTAVSKFVDATLAFRQWADEHLAEQETGEWGASYDEWASLTSAFCNLLDSTDPSDWDEHLVDLILYVLARDSDPEILQDELVARPAHLLALAKVASRSPEPDARWQIAAALGAVSADNLTVEPMLERLLQDSDEYVSRRALIALTGRGSEKLDFWAERAWKTGHQYQRMVALEAFLAAKSPLLSHYLEQADIDGREYLVRSAATVRSALGQHGS